MKTSLFWRSLAVVVLVPPGGLVVQALTTPSRSNGEKIPPHQTRHSSRFCLDNSPKSDSESLSYEDSDNASKGIVSILTNLVNSLSGTQTKQQTGTKTESTETSSSRSPPPTSPTELLQRIQADYEESNYLWTGNLDLQCFRDDCRFTDPTLTFEGTDTFATNTKNLVPLVEKFCENYESKLLSIELVNENDGSSSDENKSFIQTRWNMVGSLTASPWFFWKPQINVIGRTKFWFEPINSINEDTLNDKTYQIYFYDEEWEIPAYQALLQLITPAGTFPNSLPSNQR